MKTYITTFKIAAAIISLPCGFLLVVNIFSLNTFGTLVSSALLLLLWGSFWLLRKRIRFAFAASYLLVLVFWPPLLYQTLRRIHFVLENGGMERADGQGSPLAFLLGLTMEQFIFIPLTAVVLVGIMQWLGSNKVLNPGAVKQRRAGLANSLGVIEMIGGFLFRGVSVVFVPRVAQAGVK